MHPAPPCIAAGTLNMTGVGGDPANITVVFPNTDVSSSVAGYNSDGNATIANRQTGAMLFCSWQGGTGA